MSKNKYGKDSKHPCQRTTTLKKDIEKTIQPASIKGVLEYQGFYVGLPTGNSMWPMLRNRKDQFVIIPITEEIKPGEVALFQQKGKLILHRVINRNGSEYTLRGDNCVSCEHAPHEAIIGKLKGFYRGNSYFDCTQSVMYRLYCRTTKSHYLANKIFQAAKSLPRRLKRKAKSD